MTELAHALACALAMILTPVGPQEVSPLRHFLIEKPAADPLVPEDAGRALSAPIRLPSPNDHLQTTAGLGYVQGADWGAQFGASGGFSGVQVGLDALVTRGREGTRLDRGTVSFSDSEYGWRVDAGDVFSPLRGAARGIRATFRASGDRRPSIGVYASRPGVVDRPTVIAYRDQIRVDGQTILDAEIASDRSLMLSTEWTLPHFSAGASWRRQRQPSIATDRGLFVEVPVARGFAVGGSVLVSDIDGEHGLWRTLAVRMPVAGWLHLSLERAFNDVGGVTQSTFAASGNVISNRLRLFHRHQWGETTVAFGGGSQLIERQQIQSMASYDAGPRVQMTLQMATGWSPNGVAQHWEELQTSLRLTRSTLLQVVSAVPDVTDAARLRARFVQQLPRAFALEAEFGRLSAFQSLPNELDRSRARVMLSRTFDLATPARGGTVTGRVLDQAGRPVSGARVVLGDFSGLSDADGAYTFGSLPRGDYELSLDSAFLPAQYAWDGRRHTVTVTPLSRASIDLLVAPLNAVHGRVYVDRNANGRFDAGEGVKDIVVRLDDRVLATDADGAYSFYNVWPGAHAVRLDIARLPTSLLTAGPPERTIALGDDAPVTGVDFMLSPTGKPIQWRGIGQAGGKGDGR